MLDIIELYYFKHWFTTKNLRKVQKRIEYNRAELNWVEQNRTELNEVKVKLNWTEL